MSTSASNEIKLRIKNTFDNDVQLISSDKDPPQGLQVRHFIIWPRLFKEWIALSSVYLTIIPRARVGYEMIDSQRGA